jgi:hypothetical protein
MPSAKPRPRWWFLITPRWLAWHAFAVLASSGMLWLGDWQFHRAEGGNALSWAYTFEWPIFTVFGVVFWGKTIVDEWKTRGNPAVLAGASAGGDDDLGLPASAHMAAYEDDVEDDPELVAYNAYLASLSRRTEAGRPGGGQPGSTKLGPAAS